ncbi:hypothetical protein K493DRAFT_353332 [Basidiobolus meristosporus CBS 931.73]|uniref:Uncharacterized protein n=1 Tax=Basidiobolus meristosporus CBS 931.73 TaxID=1314790 RepID=A0A1Y1Y696_9FUNG|nr:hypothetical protein K493DRAFT_353332 [Basidiobolus meristosporus CBS 931.73]|eukprot:ORX93532.1 hypothetical protein K493DRAFT_353332 [Basidiobolus meristosporus CBS 931.73]
MEAEESQVPVQPQNRKKSVEFSETEIVQFSQLAEPRSIQHQSPSEVLLHLTPKTDEKLRQKDKAMVSQEANMLGDKNTWEERKVQFGEGSLVEVSDDVPITSSPKHKQKIQLNATADNQNPEVKQKNKRMETQEAQALLNPLPRNDNKKVQFSSASVIENSHKGASNRKIETCLDNVDDNAPTDLKTKEKSKCMELEEAQVLRNPSIANENRKVQFGLTKLIEVSEEEPPLLSPKEEKTIEFYPTPDTQKYEVKEKSKKMEAEEAQALRKPLLRTDTEEENIGVYHQAYTDNATHLYHQPASTNGVL